MQLIVDTSGLDLLRQKLIEARDALPDLLQQAAREAGEVVRQNLQDESPRAAVEGPPPPGDAEGHLADSFSVQDEPSSGGAAISVRTSQPRKLGYVVDGRGVVLPVQKKALFWPALSHPVRRADPSQPNDFVNRALADLPQAEEFLDPVVTRLEEIVS